MAALGAKMKLLMPSSQLLSSPAETPVEVHFDETLAEKFRHHLELSCGPTDPRQERELLANIPPEYYLAEGKLVDRELEQLADKVTDVKAVEVVRARLELQLHAVNKKMSELVLQNRAAYERELNTVLDLERCLGTAVMDCEGGRARLRRLRDKLTLSSLGAVQKTARRGKLLSLLRYLSTISTLQRTDLRLRELLDSGEWPQAVALALECIKVTEDLGQYSCISDLSRKLRELLHIVEDHLHVSLSKMCSSFEPTAYRKILTTYWYLGKCEEAVDQLHMHFITAIHSKAFTVVLGYVGLVGGGDGNYQRKQYQELCESLTASEGGCELFLPCLQDLSKALWDMLGTYFTVARWHSANLISSFPPDDDDVISLTDDCTAAQSYVEQKFAMSRQRIWQELHLKLRTLLLNSQLSSLKFEDFLRVLKVVQIACEIGQRFCGSESTALQEAARQQSLSFFQHYHANALEELRLFIENESWTPLYVRADFDLYHMPEFSCLHKLRRSSRSQTAAPQDDSWFQWQLEAGQSPFAELEEAEEQETAPRKECLSPQASSGAGGPLLSNCTLTVLRLTARYLSMLEALQLIAFQLVSAVSELYDLYVFAVHSYFAAPSWPSLVVSSRLQQTVSRLTSTFSHNPLPPRHPPSSSERVVAVESLAFLAEQLRMLRPHLEAVLQEAKRPFLTQFFSQTVAVSLELRAPAYFPLALNALQFDQIVLQVAATNFDVKELLSDHSRYVNFILDGLEQYVEELSRQLEGFSLPEEARRLICEQALRLANRQLVEGFASVRRCSQEGRALMQLDVQQLATAAERRLGVRPYPDLEYVDTYVKAFYLTEQQVEQFVREKEQYSQKQLTALVNTLPGLSKKTKQRIVQMIDEVKRRPQ